MDSASTPSAFLPPVASFFGVDAALDPSVTQSSDQCPSQSAPQPILASKADWQIASELLHPIDDQSEFYTLRDIAPVIGELSPKNLCVHAQDLWPRREGLYRLNFQEAIRVIRRYLQVGRRRHSRAELERLWADKYLPCASQSGP